MGQKDDNAQHRHQNSDNNIQISRRRRGEGDIADTVEYRNDQDAAPGAVIQPGENDRAQEETQAQSHKIA